ncbi:helix-turn-helix transcriptional regulator [Devosia sp. Root635]|uniref:helix-turn-helix transcriptional regulator n=1 Tax=Devosia sp. Root635 TaxID=1736575 RepID=UPI0007001487|nr:helix-turn-helix transcriptional regulator [Devosia sp. Root635]KRA56071.1 XRE family transcriptional regulator [Devosia sp. Root635]
MNEMITIPRAEYDRLREAAEDLADLQIYERAIAAKEESIPSEFVNRMIDGESPVRVFRDFRGMTQMALAKASGVNRVQIADIEAGRGKGSVETLRKLAEALRVTIDDLV